MSELFSEHWHRIRELRPRLAPDVVAAQHTYRGKRSTVLQRQSTGEIHRMDANAYELVQQLDGRLTVEAWWMRMLASDVEDVPTQPEVLSSMAALHEAGLLIVDRSLDAEQLFSRSRDYDKSDRFGRYSNPLFIRFSLGDPTAILEKLAPVGNVVFSWWGTAIFILLATLALGILLPSVEKLGLHWQQLEALSIMSGFGIFIVYPLMKVLHELAHGLALKRFGARCTEAGVAILVLLPIPYVSASSATMLTDKRQRMIVSAAGMLAELSVAALAAVVWITTTGLIQDLALVVMLVGGISTVLFNGNPLLKFDGYYLLADIIEIPNLAKRSNRYALHLLRCWVLGFDDKFTVPNDRGEKAWLLSYAALSTLYRLALTFAIAMMLSGQYFFFGFLLAGWALFNSILLPLWRGIRFVFTDHRVERSRAIPASASAFALVLVCVCVVPVTDATVVKGVVWLPDNAMVRASGNCEITDVTVPSGSDVAEGAPLLLCEDTSLESRRRQLLAELDAAQAESAGLQLTNRTLQQRLQNDINALKGQVAHLDGLASRQLSHAAVPGKFLARTDLDLLGQYVERGEVLGYVVPTVARTVRLALTEQNVHLIDKTTQDSTDITVLWRANGTTATHSTYISRQTPKATFELPTAVLSDAGGGDVKADPAGDGRQLLEPVFDIELAWPKTAPALAVGQHVAVRFRGASRPLAQRWADALQRLFLQEFLA